MLLIYMVVLFVLMVIVGGVLVLFVGMIIDRFYLLCVLGFGFLVLVIVMIWFLCEMVLGMFIWWLVLLFIVLGVVGVFVWLLLIVIVICNLWLYLVGVSLGVFNVVW